MLARRPDTVAEGSNLGAAVNRSATLPSPSGSRKTRHSSRSMRSSGVGRNLMHLSCSVLVLTGLLV